MYRKGGFGFTDQLQRHVFSEERKRDTTDGKPGKLRWMLGLWDAEVYEAWLAKAKKRTGDLVGYDPTASLHAPRSFT